MADHLDAFDLGTMTGLHPPKPGDARTDITDIYAFQKPDDEADQEGGKSILILNVNPLAPALADAFAHDAVYRLNVDTNGDAVADRHFDISFSSKVGGVQTAGVDLVSGSATSRIVDGAPVSFGAKAMVTVRGPYKFFAGFRSDPFFFDLVGFLSGFNFTGTDFFAKKNVFGIVLEVPNIKGLGPNPQVGVWGRTKVLSGGVLVNDDRMGRPAINTVFNHKDSKNIFNQTEPSADRTTMNADSPPVTFEESFIETLESFGWSRTTPSVVDGFPPLTATQIAELLLPDILTYNYTSSAGFLNGRKLTDDVIDLELTLVSHGAVTTDGVGTHTDLLSHFPYLGNPHEEA